jgi:hypothetical protein
MAQHSQAEKFHILHPHRATCANKHLNWWLILFFTLALGLAGCVLMIVGQLLFGGLLVVIALTLMSVGTGIILLRWGSPVQQRDNVSLADSKSAPPHRPIQCQDIETSPYSLCKSSTLHTILAQDAQRRHGEIRDDVACGRFTHVRL